MNREVHVEALVAQTGLADLYGKVRKGERLSYEDGLRLYRTPDLAAVGFLANAVRERMSGDVTYYVRNLHINYTNICNKIEKRLKGRIIYFVWWNKHGSATCFW